MWSKAQENPDPGNEVIGGQTLNSQIIRLILHVHDATFTTKHNFKVKFRIIYSTKECSRHFSV